MALNEHDRTLLRFAAEHPCVSYAQVAVLLDTTPAAAGRRLAALRRAGLVKLEPALRGRPSYHRITRAGLAAVGSDLPAPKAVNLPDHRHSHALAWLMLTAQRGCMGPVRDVIGERRMRSQDGRTPDGRALHAVRRGGLGPSGRELRHYPDMVVVTASGRRIAFELELGSKSVWRREGILAAYGADRRIDAVVYLVDRPAVARAIRRSAARVGVGDLVRIQQVAVDPPVATDAIVRAARREHGRGTEGGERIARPAATRRLAAARGHER